MKTIQGCFTLDQKIRATTITLFEKNIMLNQPIPIVNPILKCNRFHHKMQMFYTSKQFYWKTLKSRHISNAVLRALTREKFSKFKIKTVKNSLRMLYLYTLISNGYVSYFTLFHWQFFFSFYLLIYSFISTMFVTECYR